MAVESTIEKIGRVFAESYAIGTKEPRYFDDALFEGPFRDTRDDLNVAVDIMLQARRRNVDAHKVGQAWGYIHLYEQAVDEGFNFCSRNAVEALLAELYSPKNDEEIACATQALTMARSMRKLVISEERFGSVED